MQRTLRSNTRFDLIILSSCIVLALAARALPTTMREPVATGMRRTFLAPLVMLQERAERAHVNEWRDTRAYASRHLGFGNSETFP